MNAVVSGVAVLAFTAEELAQIAQAYMTVSQLVEKIRTASPDAWQAVTADFQQAALDWERSGAPTFPVQTPVDPGSSAPTVLAQTGEPPQLQGGEPAKSQAPTAGYPGADALPAGQHVQAITEKPTA